MDYGSLIIAAAIVVAGIYEYRRREKKHLLEMDYLRRNIVPPPDPEEPVPRLRNVSVLLTAFLAVVAAGILIFKGATFPGGGAPFIVIGCIFLALAAPLAYIFVRDRRIIRGETRED